MKILMPVRLFAVLTLLFAAALACASPTSRPDLPTLPPLATNANSDDPTAGAIIRSTRQAAATQDRQSTATSEAALAAQATGTARAATNATATVAAQATGQAILAAKSAWPRLLAEPFKDNSLGWPLGVTKDEFLSVNSLIQDGRYTWSVTVMKGNSYTNLVPKKGPVLTDFYSTVDVALDAANADNQSAYGLAFRHVGDDYGFFGILQSGSFRVLEVHHTGVYTMLMSSASGIDTRPGKVNHLAVVGIGSDFVFLINDQVVAQMHADLAPGQVGLGVDAITSARSAGVDFSNLEIHAPKP